MECVMIAVAATLAAAPPAESPPAQSSAQRHFADQLTCEQATTTATPPPGTKLVCVPVGSGTLIHTAH